MLWGGKCHADFEVFWPIQTNKQKHTLPVLTKLLAVQPGEQVGAWVRVVGGAGLFIGGFSIAWALAARPEYGNLASRWEFAQGEFSSSRVLYAFIVDLGLYALWQTWLCNDMGAPRRYCAVPFFGQAVWLLEGCPRDE